MSSTESDVDPYVLLGVKADATEQEIKTAYRQRSLKVHPDRNPNNPNAARQFHELNQGYELLLDPLRKLALDAKLRLKRARSERFASYDAKRKGLVAELEEREEAFKKSRKEKRQREVDKWKEEERIKEEGRKLREEKEKRFQERGDEMNQTQNEEDMPPEMGSLDTTVRLKYTLTTHPTLTTAASLSTLLSSFGPTDTDTIRLLLKPSKKAPEKPAKFATAVVEFKQILDAFTAVSASGRADRGLNGIQVDWVEGKEPAIVGWLKKRGVLGAKESKSQPSSQENDLRGQSSPPTQGEATTYTSFPKSFLDPTLSIPQKPGAPTAQLDYEALTLMRLRQTERERLEREIREQEGE